MIEKTVGETPLEALERYRRQHPELSGVPLAYAGRLDPMASGTLLVLIGDECKQQQAYHKLDKAYEFEVLFGVTSDTADVLGRLTWGAGTPLVVATSLERITRSLCKRTISLPYPVFSSRTVRGKPLFLWALEGRLNEIEIPEATTTIHQLRLTRLTTMSGGAVADEAIKKIAKVTPVTAPTKALGEDFRRKDVLADWDRFKTEHRDELFTIATFSCIASSGTYMRSLATYIGRALGVPALAYAIHRSAIGWYMPLPFGLGFWLRRYQSR
jgi:tRNA pseudouridine(55) synthase